MLKNFRKHALVAGALVATAAVATAQTGPDVIVWTLGGGTGSSNYNEFGPYMEAAIELK